MLTCIYFTGDLNVQLDDSMNANFRPFSGQFDANFRTEQVTAQETIKHKKELPHNPLHKYVGADDKMVYGLIFFARSYVR